MAKQVLGTDLAEAPEAPPMRPPAKKGIFQWRAH